MMVGLEVEIHACSNSVTTVSILMRRSWCSQHKIEIWFQLHLSFVNGLIKIKKELGQVNLNTEQIARYHP